MNLIWDFKNLLHSHGWNLLEIKASTKNEKCNEANIINVFNDGDIGLIDISNMEILDFFEGPNRKNRSPD